MPDLCPLTPCSLRPTIVSHTQLGGFVVHRWPGGYTGVGDYEWCLYHVESGITGRLDLIRIARELGVKCQRSAHQCEEYGSMSDCLHLFNTTPMELIPRIQEYIWQRFLNYPNSV